jgi:hypothetical protein
VSINRVRAIVLGFLALLAVGSFGASAAYGEAGPFWHHRNVGEKGPGEKINQPKDEQFQGEGGEQVLKGTITPQAVEITAKSVQVKGIIYNNALQGQIKVLLKYHEPTLRLPVLKECLVKIGTNNEVKAEGHLAWKWNGEKKQLEEQPQTLQKPDIIFTPTEIAEGAEKLPEGSFTTITLSGAGCGVLSGTFKVNGSLSTLVKPSQLEEWSTKLVTSFPGWKQQHFWNGKAFIGVEPGLTFAGNAATLTGIVESIADVQEIAVFEK